MNKIECKHKFITLQQQVISSKAYFSGLVQCEKCLKCFNFGAFTGNDEPTLKETEYE